MSSKERPQVSIVCSLPPGGSLNLRGSELQLRLPLWLYWLRVAKEHATAAEAAVVPLDVLDAIGDALLGRGTAPELKSSGGHLELQNGMIAITASAHAIDGLYGSLPNLGGWSQSSRARRARKILEALKRGFRIGHVQNRWVEELDWLFGVRDGGVHHAEDFRPAIAQRISERTAIISAAEAFDFSAASARRAADLCHEVLITCLRRPRPQTDEWALPRLRALEAVLTPPKTPTFVLAGADEDGVETMRETFSGSTLLTLHLEDERRAALVAQLQWCEAGPSAGVQPPS